MARRNAPVSRGASASLLEQRFAEAGTTFERRPDGLVAVSNMPKPRSSGSTFLSDMVAEMEADRLAREAVASGQG